jgi:hypothetical protein
MDMIEFMRVIREHAPIVVERAEKDPFQLKLFTTAGVIEIWDEAMMITIDGVSSSVGHLPDWLQRQGPLAINWSQEQDRLVLRCGSAEIRVTPSTTESLYFWGPGLIF